MGLPQRLPPSNPAATVNQWNARNDLENASAASAAAGFFSCKFSTEEINCPISLSVDRSLFPLSFLLKTDERSLSLRSRPGMRKNILLSKPYKCNSIPFRALCSAKCQSNEFILSVFVGYPCTSLLSDQQCNSVLI